jgi:hypothetical protein
MVSPPPLKAGKLSNWKLTEIQIKFKLKVNPTKETKTKLDC